MILHAGCGINPLPAEFSGFVEHRLDIDENVKPDTVASITDTGLVTGGFQAVYCSHTLEHLYAHEVPTALSEFYRVLELGGFLRLDVPNIYAVAQAIIAGRFESMLYHSPAGPIAALDILYGHRASIAAGNVYMTHKTGFTPQFLAKKMTKAGFHNVETWTDDNYNLFAKGIK